MNLHSHPRRIVHGCLGLICAALLKTAGNAATTSTNRPVELLVPGFTVEELPIQLSNQNNLRFAPDGSLTTLGYDGRVWRLRDTNGDGLEDAAEPFWDRPTLSVPVGMAWTTRGLVVSSKGKVSSLRDTDGDGRADVEEILAAGWPATDVGSGGVDATAVTVAEDGRVYFGLLVADYSNAYRLRKRSDLKPQEVDWLRRAGRWREPSGPNAGADEFSLYDLASPRGTIQRLDPETRRLETIATGIRVPYALAFNRAGDLFNTDQEGETWMPNGNPLDELNWIRVGHNYGFPPAHERWLPGLVSDAPVVGFGPQHQSACGLVFNEPHPVSIPAGVAGRDRLLPAAPAQGRFGPKWWEGNAFVAGESRGKIWRVQLAKTATGYSGVPRTIARLSLLTMDLAISPRGDLYVACHSGPPDWGTGPQGAGRLFRIRYTGESEPQPVAAWPASSTEVRVAFDRPLDSGALAQGWPKARIEFGEYVGPGDRFEVLKPPYAVVPQQDATPRGQLPILGAELADGGRTVVLRTAPHALDVRHAVMLPGIRSVGQPGEGATVDIDYDFQGVTPGAIPAEFAARLPPVGGRPAWAPAVKASAGTTSRAEPKPDGDWEHGRELYFGEQLQCGKCHRIRGLSGISGGDLGPDLSNLLFRDKATILRDIREPGATLHPDYVTFVAERTDGESVTGFVRSQSASEIRLVDVAGNENVIARKDLKSLTPAGTSLMPTGLLDGRSADEVRDLLTFLMHEPPLRERRELDSAKGPVAPPADSRPLRIVLVASKQDHGPGQHDYPAWQEKWIKLLARASTNTVVEKAWEWPTPEQFRTADVLVFYFWNHDWSPGRYAELDAYQIRGGGVALIHAAVIADKDPEALAMRIGLSAQPGRTGYRHMPFELTLSAAHPLARGLPERIPFLDEPYWPLVGDPARVSLVASGWVDGAARPLAWTFEKGKGRVFASVLGHYFWTLDDPLWRLLCLRGIAWSGGRDPALLQSAAADEAAFK